MIDQRRRRLLKLGLAASFSGGAVGVGVTKFGTSIHPEYAHVAQRLLTVTPFPVQLLDLGRAYLRSHGTTSPAALAQQIFPEQAERRAALAASPAELRQKLRMLARRDYALGALTNLGGWLISEVEARFAAIVAGSE